MWNNHINECRFIFQKKIIDLFGHTIMTCFYEKVQLLLHRWINPTFFNPKAIKSVNLLFLVTQNSSVNRILWLWKREIFWQVNGTVSRTWKYKSIKWGLNLCRKPVLAIHSVHYIILRIIFLCIHFISAVSLQTVEILHCPTKPFSILEPWNTSIGTSYLVKNFRLTYFEAPKLWAVRPRELEKLHIPSWLSIWHSRFQGL